MVATNVLTEATTVSENDVPKRRRRKQVMLANSESDHSLKGNI